MSVGVIFFTSGMLILLTVFTVVVFQLSRTKSDTEMHHAKHEHSRDSLIFTWTILFIFIAAGIAYWKNREQRTAMRHEVGRPAKIHQKWHDREGQARPIEIDPIDKMAAKLVDIIERETGALPIEIPLEAKQIEAKQEERPDWLLAEKHTKSRTISDVVEHDEGQQPRRPEYLTVIHSGFYTTPQEAEAEAYQQVSKTFQSALNQQFDYHEPWELPEEVVRQVAVRDSYMESELHDFGSAKAEMYRMYLLVDQSPGIQAELAPWLHKIVVGLRLFKWGACFAVGFVFLCISTIVLKLISRNQHAEGVS